MNSLRVKDKRKKRNETYPQYAMATKGGFARLGINYGSNIGVRIFDEKALRQLEPAQFWAFIHKHIQQVNLMRRGYRNIHAALN